MSDTLSLFDLPDDKSGECPNDPSCSHALAYHQFDRSTEKPFCEYGNCRCGAATAYPYPNQYGGHAPAHNVDTSRAAASSIEAHVSKLASTIIAFIEERGDATQDEAAVGLDMLHQTASARFTELKTAGRIVLTGEKRNTRSGRKARVWKLADA